MEEVLLEIRPDEYRAYCAGRPLDLTARELGLLTALARREGRIVSREELYDEVWHRPFRSDDRSVDVYVRKLRAKLAGVRPEWNFIHTHFGFGYRLSPERAFTTSSHPSDNGVTDSPSPSVRVNAVQRSLHQGASK
jgi:DNA-binding response OmpR family regulator